MKPSIFFKLFLTSLSAFFFTQCGDNIKYFDMTGTSGDGVYFPEGSEYIELSENANSFTVPLHRTETHGDLSVKINVNEDKNNVPGVFTVDDEVHFIDGQDITYIKVGYDISKLEYEVTQKLSLELSPETAWNYGTMQMQLSLVRPAQWIELGVGYFCDYYWAYYGYFKKGFTSLSDYYYDYVTFWQRTDNPNYYRVENPYQGYLISPYFQFQVLQKGEIFLDQTVTMDNLVAWTEAPYVFNCYGETWFWFPGYLTDVYDEEKYWVNNCVESYFDNGLPEMIKLSPLFWQGDPENETTVGWDFSGWDEEFVNYYCSLYFPVPN